MENAEYAAMAAQEQAFWWYRALHRAAVDRLLRYVPIENLANLLDAGCGTGGFLAYWQQQPQAQQAAGVDVSTAACAYSRQKTHYPLVQASLNQLPFADHSFALITSHDVLYHRAVDEQRAIAEWRRTLQPGGYLSVQVAAYQWLSSAHDRQVHGVRRYTQNQLCQRLQEGGFSIVSAGYWNSLLFPLMAVARLLSRNSAHSDVKPLAPLVNRLLFSVLDFERGIQLRLPFGGTTWAIARKLS